jgi:3-hydroxyisobutyrate dehydrogenase
MLPSTPQVEAVYLSPSGILAGLSTVQDETLLLDCTTLDPTAAKAISSQISKETSGKALMLDAPVSGGTVAAHAGKLTFMVGTPNGSKIAFNKAVPYLKRMAREGRVIHCGPSGAGLGVKVCNK